MLLLIVYLAIGLIAGMLSGLFGVGGGVIVVPSLAYIFAQQAANAPNAMKMAVATSLAVMIMTSLSALYAHHQRGNVRWLFFWRMLPFLMVGAALGSFLVHLLPAAYLRIGFAIFLFGLGGRLFFGKHESVKQENALGLSSVLFAFFSTLTGLLSGLLGVGGGTLLVPFLLRAGLTMQEAAGTAVVGGLVGGVTATLGFLFTTLVTLFRHEAAVNYIHWTAFCAVALASVFAAPLGAQLGRYLPHHLAKRLFGLLLLLVAIDMVWMG